MGLLAYLLHSSSTALRCLFLLKCLFVMPLKLSRGMATSITLTTSPTRLPFPSAPGQHSQLPPACCLQLPGSRLVLVAVANSLDLTERRLPELHARGCRPQLLQFPAYSRDQILSILQQRLDTLPGPVFATKALEFCARKVGTCGACGSRSPAQIWAACSG